MQDESLQKLKAAGAEADLLRQALTRQVAGENPAEAEMCRQAEQLLAQQVPHSLSHICTERNL